MSIVLERTFAQKAAEAWGGTAPDWILELAASADKNGLRKAGERIGYSAPVVSQALARKYAGDMGRLEEMVRGALMAATVECPVLGEIGRDRCLREQDEPFRATSAYRAHLFHACKRCPNARNSGGEA